MAEIERTRERERPPIKQSTYELEVAFRRERTERNERGPIVIRMKDREEVVERQGRVRFYLQPRTYTDTPLQMWSVFTHEIRTKSGRHRHQGGVLIYVLRGKGYSIVEGERVDWSKGDLVLLPMREGGIEHQHFNLDTEPSVWAAFIHYPTMEHLASGLEHTENSPEYRE